MSVTTTADRKLEEAKYHIKEAYNCLHEVLDKDTWGSEDFSYEYGKKLEKALQSLRKINKRL